MSDMSQQPTLDQLVQGNAISTGSLPAQQDFTFLKQEGIKQIKSLAGHVWSNFNESDPGVTILDQVCYALTELGYVNSFPIEDVLTQADGKIDYQQQFFRAEEILTTAPVTPDDYRRLVIDQVEQVDNLYLQPVTALQQPTGLYQVAIYSRTVADNSRTAADGLIITVHRLLNQQRNLAEYFLLPVLLRPQPIELCGQILLTQEADPQQVAKQIDLALADYVSPQVRQQGYQQLVASGNTADTIFNGPLLENGWICEGESSLGEKRQQIQLVDLMVLISAVAGVAAVEQLYFAGVVQEDNVDKESVDKESADKEGSDKETSQHIIVIEQDRVAEISLSRDFQMETYQSSQNMVSPSEQAHFLSRLHARHQANPIEASVDLAPPLPEGRYRNIESYYSIQNTFPQVYGVGANSLQSDSPDYRIAQARQLKGYLLLFDQVMANQFSQLANLGHLFSFSFGSGVTAENTLIQRYTPVDSDPQTMGIPIQSFVRSYFYQPLYDVPDIQALLQGQNRYQYFYPDDPDEPKQREKLVWQRFRRDPFNSYYYGLARSIETTDEAEQRRDTMLSHLLARHGEPADLYNEMIDASQWYGGKLKTRIIIKGVWLQNLQALSYRRNQAGDFFRAQPLTTPGRFHLDSKDYRQLMNSRHASKLAPSLQAIYRRGFADRKAVVAALAQSRIAYLRALLVRQGMVRQGMAHQGHSEQSIHHDQVVKRCQAIADVLPLKDGNQQLLESEQAQYKELMRDGVLDAKALNRFVKLTEQDYADFSVFELKCAIMLGTARHLQTLAIALVRLKQIPDFLRWLDDSPQDGSRFPESKTVTEMADSLRDISVLWQTDVQKQSAALVVQIGEQPVLMLPVPSDGFTGTQLQQYIDQLDWLSRVRRGFVLVEETLLQSVPETKTPSGATDSQPDSTNSQSENSPLESPSGYESEYGLKATLAFPDYVVLTQQRQFLSFLAELEQLHWPAHIALQLRQGNYQQMSTLISCYCAWYNQQIRQTRTDLTNALASSKVDTSAKTSQAKTKGQTRQQALQQALQVLQEVKHESS
jgi:hypothetical protein